MDKIGLILALFWIGCLAVVGIAMVLVLVYVMMLVIDTLPGKKPALPNPFDATTKRRPRRNG